jgi:hypothetical protein
MGRIVKKGTILLCTSTGWVVSDIAVGHLYVMSHTITWADHVTPLVTIYRSSTRTARYSMNYFKIVLEP